MPKIQPYPERTPGADAALSRYLAGKPGRTPRESATMRIYAGIMDLVGEMVADGTLQMPARPRPPARRRITVR